MQQPDEARKAKLPGRHLSATNLYRERWTLPLSGARLELAGETMRVQPQLVHVIERFPGGMVYEVDGKKYVLSEQTFLEHPFLLVFSLEPLNEQAFFGIEFTGLPDQVMRQCRDACEQMVRKVQLPENVHNIEVDLTSSLGHRLTLPAGWNLTKVIMKVPIRDALRARACDVDGPCGYCCDTCDCNSCYNCC